MTPIQTLAIEDQVFQLITLGAILLGIGLEIYQWAKSPTEWYWIVSNLAWMFHGAFFYIFLILDRYTTWKMQALFGSYTMWSSILRLHIVATVVVLEWYRIRQYYLREVKRTLNSRLLGVKELEVNRQLAVENKNLLTNIHDILEEERKNQGE